MSKRKSVRRVGTEDLQGEGSYVVMTALKVKEIRAARKRASDDSLDPYEEGLKMIARHIQDWNWVDDEGEPLPTPAQDPNVLNELTNEETDFLSELLTGAEAAKN